MKRSLVVFVVTLAIALAVVWGWKTRGERQAVLSHGKVTANVEVLEGTVRLDTPDGVQTLQGGEVLIASATGTLTVAPEVTVLEHESSPQSEPSLQQTNQQSLSNLTVSILDALDEAVPDASLRMDGQEFRAQNGRVTIPALTEGQYTLVASAPGYTSVEQTIASPTDSNVRITLEYLCSFDVAVEALLVEKGKNPKLVDVEGAEITVWEGPRVERPVSKTGVITYDRPTTAHHAYVDLHVRREPEGFVIFRADRPENAGNELGWDGDRRPPEQGDTITGISGSMWQAGKRSSLSSLINEHETEAIKGFDSCSPLRIWDAFMLRKVLGGNDLFEFERKGIRYYFYLWGQDDPTLETVCRTGLTNSSGRCSFKDLPAGGYLVQARKGEERSRIELVHPAQKQASLRLMPNYWISVVALKRGVVDRQLASIEGASVLIKNSDNRSKPVTLIGETSSYGEWNTSIPWGTYQVHVEPPAGSGIAGPAQDKTIIIDGIHSSIEFEFNSAEMVELSGYVLRHDNKTPVSGYSLRLKREDEASLGYWQEFAVVQSDTNGQFAFKDVVPGHYQLEDAIDGERFNGFLSAKRFEPVTETDAQWQETPFDVKTTGIADIHYYVVPAIETRLSGQVMASNGQPVPNAELTLADPKRFVPLHTKNKSAADGRFELAFRAMTVGERQTVELIGKRVEYKKVMETSLPGATEQAERLTDVTVAEGRLPVQFNPGERVSDLKLVLQDRPTGGVLQGKISTEDGVWPFQPLPDVYGAQDRTVLPAILHEDGTFEIDGIQSGKFGVRVRCEFGYKRVNEPKLYSDESYELTMPDPPTTLTLEVLLKKAAVLTGKLIDEKGNPLHDVMVGAQGENSNDYSNIAEDGSFFLNGLRPGIPHTIVVRLKGERDYIKTLEGVIPPQDNILIQVNTQNNESGG